ncbi:MAG: ion transporter [Anaerolineae bacterium]|nr:ion transporter [Thermoflexales bacterium]MDW8396555.1 ion transporter [Anaerolineae bacterium]
MSDTRESPLRRAVWRVLETASGSDSDRLALDIYDVGMSVLIALNVIAVVLESVAELAQAFGTAFQVFEVVSVAVFTMEYALRLWACTVEPRFAHPVWGRVRFALTPMALIDLAAFLPSYLMFLAVDLRLLRLFRLLRLLRVLKLGRYSQSLALIGQVFRRKLPDLSVTMLILLVALVLASSVMYYVEHEAQPEAFSSIPAAMWWGVATFTTIGYGDIYPITPLGKIVGSFVAVLGIGIFALPAGILAAGFSEERERLKVERGARTCPHCGKPID